MPSSYLFQKLIAVFLMTETIALCDQRIRFQCDQVYV